MPLLIPYLLKLSISLAVLYIFYRFALRRLTFYNWNRWYLLGYSVLCFFIPFINLTDVLGKGLEHRGVVRLVPSVDAIAPATLSPVALQNDKTFSSWEGLLLVLVLGSVFLLGRLVVQYISFWRVKQKAQLLSHDGVKLYGVNESIAPFSFGNAIFINQHQYNEAELQEIIRHEFVHVKQGHSIDVVWSELLCILNWYNPFAWLLRKAIRQNLEFIADNKVLQNGIDKKAYQYLLLNVMGNRQFSMASPFNFSSLKKRIVMMNKMKSAQVHLVKFLFVLPLLALLLLAFRTYKQKKNKATYAIVFFDADSFEPLSGVAVKDVHRGTTTFSDGTGYYTASYPMQKNIVQVSRLNFSKKGYYQFSRAFSHHAPDENWDGVLVEFIALRKGSAQKPCTSCLATFWPTVGEVATRQSIMESFKRYVRLKNEGKFKPAFADTVPVIVDTVVAGSKEKNQIDERVQSFLIDKIVGSSAKPIWVIDGIPYAISANGSKAWFDEDEVKDSPEFRVWVDGKIITLGEANATIDRFGVHGVGAAARPYALEKYGVNYNLLLLNLEERGGDWTKVDTVPRVSRSGKPTSTLPEDYKAFLKRNPSVKNIHWTKTTIRVALKSGKVETYTRHDKKSIASAERKYGPLPTAPPPPPMVNLDHFKAPAKQNVDLSGDSSLQERSADQKAFLKRNPTIGKFLWIAKSKFPKEDDVPYKAFVIRLKNGKEEVVDLNNAAEVQKFEKKYGTLPVYPSKSAS